MDQRFWRKSDNLPLRHLRNTAKCSSRYGGGVLIDPPPPFWVNEAHCTTTHDEVLLPTDSLPTHASGG